MVRKTQFLVKNGQNGKKNSGFGKKIRLFSDKDFVDWQRPPPLLTESEKKSFFMPPLSVPISNIIPINIFSPCALISYVCTFATCYFTT